MVPRKRNLRVGAPTKRGHMIYDAGNAACDSREGFADAPADVPRGDSYIHRSAAGLVRLRRNLTTSLAIIRSLPYLQSGSLNLPSSPVDRLARSFFIEGFLLTHILQHNSIVHSPAIRFGKVGEFASNRLNSLVNCCIAKQGVKTKGLIPERAFTNQTTRQALSVRSDAIRTASVPAFIPNTAPAVKPLPPG